MPPEDSHIGELAQRLTAERPVPAAAFRGDLRRMIASVPAQPRRLWFQAAMAAGSGAACFLVVGLGLLGAGPVA
jgi:hypothetical protein